MYSETDAVVIPVAFFVMAAVSLLLALLLRKRTGWVRALPTALVATLVLLLEIEKQRQNIAGVFYEDGYSRFALPLHYCSLFAFLFPLAELCGRRLRRVFQPMAVATSLTVTVALLFGPQGILGSANDTYFEYFRSFHAVTYHMLVVFYLFLTAALGRYRPSRGDLLLTAVAVAVYIAVALPHAYALDVNYCNFLHSVIPLVEELRLAVGQVTYVIGVCALLVGGTVFASWVYGTVYRLLSRKEGSK